MEPMRTISLHDRRRLIQRDLYHRMDAQALRLLIDGILNCGGQIKDRRLRPTSRRFVVIGGGRGR
jgi:hypothetical protein